MFLSSQILTCAHRRHTRKSLTFQVYCIISSLQKKKTIVFISIFNTWQEKEQITHYTCASIHFKRDMFEFIMGKRNHKARAQFSPFIEWRASFPGQWRRDQTCWKVSRWLNASLKQQASLNAQRRRRRCFLALCECIFSAYSTTFLRVRLLYERARGKHERVSWASRRSCLACIHTAKVKLVAAADAVVCLHHATSSV